MLYSLYRNLYVKQKLRNTNFKFVVNNFATFGGSERHSMILATYIQQNVSKKMSLIAFHDGTGFMNQLQEQGFDTYYFSFSHKASKIKKVFQYWNLVQFMKGLKHDVLIPFVEESNKIDAQIRIYIWPNFAFRN